MIKSRILFFLALIAVAPLLAACGTSCDCPRCPNTTVVTPPHSTVITPND